MASSADGAPKCGPPRPEQLTYTAPAMRRAGWGAASGPLAASAEMLFRGLPPSAPLGNDGIDVKELLRPCRAGITIYAPMLVLDRVLGIGYGWSYAVTGLVILYTTVGGAKAVSATIIAEVKVERRIFVNLHFPCC